MDYQDYSNLVKSLSRTERLILHEARERGKVGAPDLRQPTGRTDGLTAELHHLMALGLLRSAGRAPRGEKAGIRPKLYAIVPMDDVEQARAAYKPRKPIKRGARSAVKELRPGSYREWSKTQDRVVTLVPILEHRVAKLAYLESAPKDERELARKHITRLRDACNEALEALEVRAEDDGNRATIKKLNAVTTENGATPSEAARAQEKAALKREKLL